MPILPEKEQCDYTKCYCEENVWRLCKYIKSNSSAETLSDTYVIFISNPAKAIPIWKQKSSKREDTMVLWDYHVILLHKSERCIYDLDTMLSFPCPVQEYLSEALKCSWVIKPEYRQMLRVVTADRFLEVFASNRSHMMQEDGTWLSPPPKHPLIQTSSSSNNLNKFIGMTDELRSEEYGSVFTLKEFLKRFS